MQKTTVEIADGFYQSFSLPLNAQRCVNWVPVIPELTGLSNTALFDPPGISSFCTLPLSPCYGAQEMGNYAYFVNGSHLYRVDANGSYTDIGNIYSTSRVSIANNGTKMVIVNPGATAWVYDSSLGTLTQITDPDFITSDTVVFKDGYFIFTATNGRVFFCSEINDPLNFDPLKFGTAEIDPDDIIAAWVDHNELFVLGKKTTEQYQDVGGTGFPFQRIEGANSQKGCYAKFSLCTFDNTFLFVGGGNNETAAIWKAVGSSNVQKISTAAIDYQIQQFTRDEISTAFAWTYSWQGSFFAGFTFESSRIPSKTFVFDATSSALSGKMVWHERQTGMTDNRWRVNAIVAAYGKILVGDSVSGKVGIIQDGVYTDYGELRYRMKTSRPFFMDELPLFQGQMELTMESGTGLNNGLGSDPQLRFDYSDDGGRTYSYPTRRSYGELGNYDRLCIWRRLGRIPRHRVLRFITTEPVKSNLLKLCSYVDRGTQ